MSNPFYSILIIIVSLGFSFFYVKPEYDTSRGGRDNLATLDATLKNTGQIQTLIDQTANTMSSIDAEKLSRFSVFLPETTDPLRLANNIQHIGLSHGIFLQKIKVGDPTKLSEAQPVSGSEGFPVGGVPAAASTPKYATIKTTFSFTTSDTAFKAFLGDIEKNLGLMNVTALTFAPVDTATTGKKTSSNSLYQYDVEIETYSLN